MVHLDKHVVCLILSIRKTNLINLPEELVHIIGVKAILVRMSEIRELQCSVLHGVSTFARKRRAKRLGVCHRCYRDKPGYYFTKRCDGKTCVPNSLEKEGWIRYGLSKPLIESLKPESSYKNPGWLLRNHVRSQIEIVCNARSLEPKKEILKSLGIVNKYV